MEDGSVEFFNAVGESNSRAQCPQLYSFKSNYTKNICQYLENNWEDCAKQPDQLPIYLMKDEDGKLIYQREFCGVFI